MTCFPLLTFEQVGVGAVVAVMAAPALIGSVLGISAAGPVAGGLFAAAQGLLASVFLGGPKQMNYLLLFD